MGNISRILMFTALAVTAVKSAAATPAPSLTDLAALLSSPFGETESSLGKDIRLCRDLAYSTRGDAPDEGAGYTGGGYGRHRSGTLFDLRFDKALFATEKGMSSFVSLAKSYFKGGGQQLSVNVLNPEELKDAQAHPERYGDLIVRVGGYSDYFVRLSRDLQDNIIARTNY